MRLPFPLVVALAVLALGGVPSAAAQTMEPLSYSNAPIGLNFLIAGYSRHQSGNVLADPSLPVRNVEASVDAGNLAYSRIIDVWGQSGSLATVVPYALLSASGEVSEQARSTSCGFHAGRPLIPAHAVESWPGITWNRGPTCRGIRNFLSARVGSVGQQRCRGAATAILALVYR